MLARLKRSWPLWLLDAQAVVALAFPSACWYLRWLLFALYAALSWRLFVELSTNRWIVTMRDPRTRIVHGLEHAALALLQRQDVPVNMGFTPGPDRYVVVLDEAGLDHQLANVRRAAIDAIDRIQRGERALAYHPGCGTSEVVVAVTLWAVYVASAVVALAVGSSVELFFALSVIAFRIWLASVTSLGLLTQRLYTVTATFASARIVDVRPVSRVGGRVCPDGRTWFEVAVEVEPLASSGGSIAPGMFAN